MVVSVVCGVEKAAQVPKATERRPKEVIFWRQHRQRQTEAFLLQSPYLCPGSFHQCHVEPLSLRPLWLDQVWNFCILLLNFNIVGWLRVSRGIGGCAKRPFSFTHLEKLEIL